MNVRNEGDRPIRLYPQEHPAGYEEESQGESETNIVEPWADLEKSFPWKLHKMLEDTEKESIASIISWTSDGRAFKVHERTVFSELVAPIYFSQSQFKSFQR
jgi:hypothetical protein